MGHQFHKIPTIQYVDMKHSSYMYIYMYMKHFKDDAIWIFEYLTFYERCIAW
jgi:hypothetical protein